MTARLLAAGLLLCGAALAGCGSQSELRAPPPMFGGGPQPSSDQLAAQAAAARARAEGNAAADPAPPQSALEQREGNWQRGDVPPPRAAPIQGTPPDPNSAQPPGALPDPYNYPGQAPGR
jgi:hypothetical protein